MAETVGGSSSGAAATTAANQAGGRRTTRAPSAARAREPPNRWRSSRRRNRSWECPTSSAAPARRKGSTAPVSSSGPGGRRGCPSRAPPRSSGRPSPTSRSARWNPVTCSSITTSTPTTRSTTSSCTSGPAPTAPTTVIQAPFTGRDGLVFPDLHHRAHRRGAPVSPPAGPDSSKTDGQVENGRMNGSEEAVGSSPLRGRPHLKLSLVIPAYNEGTAARGRRVPAPRRH